MISICVKSGTNGYYDYDNCDMLIKNINVSNVPYVGDIIEIGDSLYLVREIRRMYVEVPQSDSVREFIYVYVINA